MSRKNSPEKPKDIAASYNEFKEFQGKKYTGVKIGRGHKWYYDAGEWKETKKTPDLWEVNYNVKKKRAGKALEGSGAPVGTQYHWYILAHQNVEKLDANAYSTAMRGFKFKLAHKRAEKDKWNVFYSRLIKLFQSFNHQLEQEELEEQAAKKQLKRQSKKKSEKPL